MHDGRDMKIHGLHHNAYRCRDAEETRKFYEDFLGLPMVNAFEITTTKSGRQTHVLHLFFQMQDGSCLAFFEAPESEFDFKEQHDFDLHIALDVPRADLEPWMARAEKAGVATRGIADHGFIHSIYFRDPNGYVIELTARVDGHDAAMDPEQNGARAALDAWQKTKPTAVY
jgi:catechol 2,3-dioxygenase-like lactoylglutathione lyase family enzyme